MIITGESNSTFNSGNFLEKERRHIREKMYAINLLKTAYINSQVERWKNQLAKSKVVLKAVKSQWSKSNKSGNKANACFIESLTKALTDEEAYVKQQVHNKPWSSTT